MAIQLMEAVQKRLGLPPLVKITPDKAEAQQQLPKAPFHQIALVAVVAGLYKITRTDTGCAHLLLSGKTINWLQMEEAFGEHFQEVVSAVSAYGVSDTAATEGLMRKAADACLLILHEELAGKINTTSIRDFMSSQRHDILVYVPTDLKLGKIVNDNVWDDQTNHMEGPVSSFMHKIENLFS